MFVFGVNADLNSEDHAAGVTQCALSQELAFNLTARHDDHVAADVCGTPESLKFTSDVQFNRITCSHVKSLHSSQYTTQHSASKAIYKIQSWRRQSYPNLMWLNH
jgi:hypothetical protein